MAANTCATTLYQVWSAAGVDDYIELANAQRAYQATPGASLWLRTWHAQRGPNHQHTSLELLASASERV